MNKIFLMHGFFACCSFKKPVVREQKLVFHSTIANKYLRELRILQFSKMKLSECLQFIE
jgi:hypothetical protein